MSARSFWKGTISFGLLNIPVGLRSSEEGEGIHFSLLDPRNMSRIKFKRVNEKTGKEVPYQKIAKGYEYAKNEYVIVSDKDIKAANPRATQTIDIEDFVDASDIDPVFFEKPYYVVPEKQGVKGYNLLRDALRKEKKAAIGKIVMHTHQHLVALLPRGDYLVLEQLRFAHEVLTENEAHFLDDEAREKGRYTPKELRMAQSLVKEMSARWNPEKYKDTYYRDLMARIKALVKAGKGAAVAEPEESAPAPSNMVDLMPLLRQSLAARGRRRRRRGAA